MTAKSPKKPYVPQPGSVASRMLIALSQLPEGKYIYKDIADVANRDTKAKHINDGQAGQAMFTLARRGKVNRNKPKKGQPILYSMPEGARILSVELTETVTPAVSTETQTDIVKKYIANADLSNESLLTLVSFLKYQTLIDLVYNGKLTPSEIQEILS